MRPLLYFILILTTGAIAHAHAFIDHTEPRVGSTVSIPPAHVKLWMTEDLEPAFSQMQVFDAKGAEIDRKDTVVSGATMAVSLPKTGPGIYLVKWKAVATDTHQTSGTFSFTIQ